ncbi:ACP S-malonyltransferase [Aliidiomarina haloalkalitolerans]|uniref:[acyl-carrier-protein] S-malonyltransferase n=1 Tax=Aliidiomarina haloalkalitolerans TaxID=859059 RepID=A0A432VW30_9GAMM|nr:ACP S-malonyltransferase [Aliidiomarina haloalkalitolerans]RUO20755.1 malonyl CoA-ACP transacylase [Aliidiomarina haloalkalitolerans]
MSREKLRALVVCPGRGTYNRAELGYLATHHGDRKDMLDRLDAIRKEQGETPIQELDSAKLFKSREHLAANNAAPLIYACSYSDFLSIDQDRFEIAAVTGNSMGWYIALACAGALDAEKGLELVGGMAALTGGQEGGGQNSGSQDLGGQLIYPDVNDDWQADAERQALIESLLHHSDDDKRLYRSIRFGGYQVLAGPDSAIKHAMTVLPPLDDRYPLVLPGHSAFHTSLMADASKKALEVFAKDFFSAPKVPMIDGRGVIWQPLGTDVEALRQYTLVHQVCETYDFSQAILTGVKEFAPDVIILTGPGATMGGAVAQALIAEGWHEMHSKADFIAQQKDAQAKEEYPYIISLGMEQQRALVSK